MITETTPSRLERAREAHRILVRQGLRNRTESMSHRDRLFIEQTTQAVLESGDRVMITPWHLVWLRSLETRYR